MAIRGNYGRRLVELLSARLPAAWAVVLGPSRDRLTLTAPDRRRGKFALVTRERLEPREVAGLVAAGRGAGDRLLACRYLSPSTRERLREAGLSHADLTGNLWLTLSSPGLFLEAQGALRDPRREERPTRTLKGPRAGRIVRALCDLALPVGVRELAARAHVDPGYTSRVLALLEREALVVRERRGPVTDVDRERLVRRWAGEAPWGTRSTKASFIAPRGLQELIGRLSGGELRVVVTGSLAASRLAAVAPPRLACLYVEHAGEAAHALGLEPADSGANVLLVEPADAVAFERARTVGGLELAAPSQVVADLLSGPGRSPAEAEALLGWLRENPEEWRRG